MQVWRRRYAKGPKSSLGGHRTSATLANGPLVWVKFGDPWRQAEADMQTIAWQSMGPRRTPDRALQPGHPHSGGFQDLTDLHGTFCLIIELVATTVLAKSVATTVLAKSVFAKPRGSLHPVEACYNLIAETVQVLRQMLTPSDAIPGLRPTSTKETQTLYQDFWSYNGEQSKTISNNSKNIQHQGFAGRHRPNY